MENMHTEVRVQRVINVLNCSGFLSPKTATFSTKYACIESGGRGGRGGLSTGSILLIVYVRRLSIRNSTFQLRSN